MSVGSPSPGKREIRWSPADPLRRLALLLGLLALVGFMGDARTAIAGPLDLLLTLAPSSATLPTKGSQSFVASGGTPPYTFTLQQNGSGGSVDGTGAYMAGAVGPTTDVVEVTDSLGATATANVNVGASLAVSPANPAAPPKGTVAFAATGGSGTGQGWSVTTNASGGSIDPVLGTYIAGALPNTTDTVTVTDSLGNVASVNVSVGAGISINPAAPTPPPRGSLTFLASGGSGTGYSWSFVTNASVGTLTAATGAYKAGAIGNVTDVVKVTDSLGNAATVSISVGAGVAITAPATSTPPRGSIAFGVTGGSGTGYAWALPTNASSGTIDALTGVYKAGATGSVTDVARVTDSLGNTATVSIIVGAAVTVTPSAPVMPPKGAVSLVASGGSGTGYSWSFVTNASTGTLDPATGAYTAGSTGSVSDVVKVVDSLGNTRQVTIVVTASVSISPPTPSTPPNGTIILTGNGGSATGLTWTVPVNHSGATLTPTGVTTVSFKAGPTGAVTDTVQVTDSLGNTASVNVSVGGGLSINPATPSTPPKGAVAFTVSGGSGTGYSWSIPTNPSGGTIVAATGAYTAGAAGSVTDGVKVQDSLGNVATVSVAVGAGVAVAPGTASVAPLGGVSFGAGGGSGAGYTWSFATNASGGSISVAGVYKAGPTGSVADVIKATDSLGNTGTATVTVRAALALSPPAPTTPPKGALAFTASGGAGSYSFTLATNASGGNVSATSGAYTAGAVGSVVDVVRVTDANGAVATANVTVGAVVKITPSSTPSPPPLATVQFSATGGSGAGYTWALTVNASGGAVNASTGLYRAGPTGSVLDTVVVTDSLGNTATVSVSVGGGLMIVPSQVSLPPKGKVGFAAQGGSGTGFVWTLEASPSGGAIDKLLGTYTAGAVGNVEDVVKVTDSLGRSTTALVDVGAPVAITPAVATVHPGETLLFSASGGSAAGYAFGIVSASGSTVTPDGTYTAGPTGGVVDTVELSDSLGNIATATVTVTALATPPSDPSDAGSAGPSGEVVVHSDSGGCSCAVAGAGGGAFAAGGAAAALGLAALLGRRRRRGGSPKERAAVGSSR